MGDQCIGKIYRTEDHSKFKHLEGNRAVSIARANKIKKSIEKNGYIFNPIIVNEKFEIIDGGGRQHVLEELQMPIDYIVKPGLTIADCQALNSASSNWKLTDYIESYAECGNVNYIYLRNLMKQFPDQGVECAVFSINGTIAPNKEAIVRGDFLCDEAQYNNAIALMTYGQRFMSTILTTPKARRAHIVCAILFARTVKGVDYEDLQKRFQKYYPSDLVSDIIKSETAFIALSTIYNYRRKDKKIYFEHEYKLYADRRAAIGV